MRMSRNLQVVLAAVLVITLVGGFVVLMRSVADINRRSVVAYFANTNGLFVGDEVRILGVRVGLIDKIEPQGERVKVAFWYDAAQKVPADAEAVILSPTLVTSRAIQLTPAYTGGPTMPDDAVIPEERTAVPVEWDDLRDQLKKLTATLQPTQPGGVSTLGSLVNTAADNLRGRGADIRAALTKLSSVYSALGDHSNDVYGTVKNLSALVSALQGSTDIMRELNQNLASVTGLLVDSPNEVGNAVEDINSVVGDVTTFVAENRETLGTTSDKLASLTTALNDSKDDIEQALHLAPNAFQNFLNIYQPAQGALTGALVVNNFANPITFLCSAIQAASRLGAEQAAKLCVQYLAPIIKNRQYNFPPLGENLFVGATARPNEITYSEDWMRPDFVPPAAPSPPEAPAPNTPPLAAEAPQLGGGAPAVPAPPPSEPRTTDPSAGLTGLMVPPGAGS